MFTNQWNRSALQPPTAHSLYSKSDHLEIFPLVIEHTREDHHVLWEIHYFSRFLWPCSIASQSCFCLPEGKSDQITLNHHFPMVFIYFEISIFFLKTSWTIPMCTSRSHPDAPATWRCRRRRHGMDQRDPASFSTVENPASTFKDPYPF